MFSLSVEYAMSSEVKYSKCGKMGDELRSIKLNHKLSDEDVGG
jgi:hypothetical protein